MLQVFVVWLDCRSRYLSEHL